MVRKFPAVVSLILLSLFLAVGLSPLAASPESSEQINPKLYQGLRWRLIGPFRGGRSLAVTGVSSQPDVFYFGAVDGGVWRTNDAGRTWNPIFDSQSVASIGAIAVDQVNPNIIYVGTGEADMRSNIASGDGMYKSTDAGKTWTNIGLKDTQHISRILIDPQDPNKIFVAALGRGYGPNAERGVFRSNDGGKTWLKILYHDENTGAIDLAFEPGNPSTIYAALWQTRRPPWHVYPPSNGPGTGLYRSKDGGEHWEHLTGDGLPSEGLGRMGIAIAPSNPRRIYLIVDAKEGGLYRSDDGASTWQRINDDHRLWNRGWYFSEVTVDPRDENTVYLPAVATYRSRDGGKTLTAIKGAPGGDDYHALWIDPKNPQHMALSSDQGTIVSLNGAETWSSWYNQPTAQFYHVITDNRFPYWVYGAEQDSGAIGTASRGNFRALDSHDWRPIETGDENGYLAPDPLDSQIIYGGFVTRQDLHTEETQQIPPGLAQSVEIRRNWTSPLIFSPRDQRVLYYGSQFLFRTDNKGNSWTAISPDLSRENPGAPPNLDPPTIADAPEGKRRGAIYTIAPSYLETDQIWVGTDDGLVHLTRDAGKTWTNVTPPELTPWSKVTQLEASHFDAATAYAAIDRHRLDDVKPYLYRTRDFGKTWQSISRGIPDGDFLNSVKEDPLRKGLLFACTEHSIFVSFDDGDNWHSLRLNLPITSVRDIVIHHDDLVIATHGRAFWILDDITPLRQLTAQVASSDVWLFEPQTALRIRPGTNQGGDSVLDIDQGTPVPLDEPQANNPPDGAILDYYLREKASTPVQLEIRDADGKLVRHYASDMQPWNFDPKDVQFTTQWISDKNPPSAEPGMYRFVWNLHYPLPASIHRSAGGPNEPWAPPGKYTVTLTVNGKSLSQPLIVANDPRVVARVKQSDLVLEFQAASRLVDYLADISTALQQTENLQKQIDERGKTAGSDTSLKHALDDLNRKIGDFSGKEIVVFFPISEIWLPSARPVTLQQAFFSLGELLTIVESADAAPSADATKSIGQWNVATKDVVARWNALLADLPGLNAQLQKHGLPPLQPGSSH